MLSTQTGCVKSIKFSIGATVTQFAIKLYTQKLYKYASKVYVHIFYS